MGVSTEYMGTTTTDKHLDYHNVKMPTHLSKTRKQYVFVSFFSVCKAGMEGRCEGEE